MLGYVPPRRFAAHDLCIGGDRHCGHRDAPAQAGHPQRRAAGGPQHRVERPVDQAAELILGTHRRTDGDQRRRPHHIGHDRRRIVVASQASGPGPGRLTECHQAGDHRHVGTSEQPALDDRGHHPGDAPHHPQLRGPTDQLQLDVVGRTGFEVVAMCVHVHGFPDHAPGHRPVHTPDHIAEHLGERTVPVIRAFPAPTGRTVPGRLDSRRTLTFTGPIR